MPIKRLKSSTEEELITHIKNSMAIHEEEYAPGAWEKFNQKDKKRSGIIYWIGGLSSAAALLLIGFGLFLFQPGKINNTVANQSIINKPASIERSDPNKDKESLTNGHTVSAQVEEGKSDKIALSPTVISNSDPVFAAEESLAANLNATISPTLPATDNSQQHNSVAVTTPDQPVRPEKKPLTVEEFLAKENQRIAATQQKTNNQATNNKWDLGLVVAPSIGNNDKLNMGYGVSMAYNLNNKVSLGSGLSYNEMGASKQIVGNNAPNSPSSNALVSDSKSLQSINTHVTGIDIPLEIRYNLSSRFYANVGVSAFAVINQQQNNVYLQGTVVQRSALDFAGDLQPQSFLVTEKVSEKAPETIAPDSKLIGFYNFSFGYKQRIFKDKSIGIEPFMKVPMKNVTKENLRLLGTGLKIKFDF
ncbi:MAG: hypothetical protein WKF66_01895 [Pedobacter sp.]